MAFIDGTVVNVALPVLQAELNATVVDVQWIVVSYALFLAALILVGGALGDQFGRRRIFASGVPLLIVVTLRLREKDHEHLTRQPKHCCHRQPVRQ